ncbi:hypothetical protein CCR75_007224 [Bremia lactucae]|uniref:Uncharacterized protein n=1 Tax=Bremia lactucae TaxID=4779 RepID=A0A976FEV0_BRELC|nr:hypothetical protein CCR75_007224 [Bremia lactucae]
MATAGRWQLEYDRDWRNYARQVIKNQFGLNALQCTSAVTQADEHQLREVLTTAGIKHVPINHRRWQAAMSMSQTPTKASAPHESQLSDLSYVYTTPPPFDSHSMFPVFDSQDFVSQLTPQRRVSASQRLRLRVADVSPISDNRRRSIECAGTISPPSGAAKSPWTPKNWSLEHAEKTRSTPRRSLEVDFRDNLDDSMHSMRLSGDESHEIQEYQDSVEVQEDKQIFYEGGTHEEETKFAVTSEVIRREEKEQKVKATLCGDNAVDTQDQVMHDADEKNMNVSKKLNFGRDNARDDSQESGSFESGNNDVTNVLLGDTDRSRRLARQSLLSEDKTEMMPKASEANCDGGGDRSLRMKKKRKEDQEQESAMHKSKQLIAESAIGLLSQTGGESTQEKCRSKQDVHISNLGSTSILAFKNPKSSLQPTPAVFAASSSLHAFSRYSATRYVSPETPIALSRKKRTYNTLTASSMRPTNSLVRRKELHKAPITLETQETQTPPTPGLSAVLSRKRANRRALLHTKLPLELEYRFASDRRRRHRRRKSLAAKPGVFPHVTPELMVELQPYQREALLWMLERESNPGVPFTIDQQRNGDSTAADALVAKVCGGILADEMGLGKTICCLALICESLRQVRAADVLARSKTGSSIPTLTSPTLIVTPLSILSQWEQEIRAKTNLSVVTYQGASRQSFQTAAQFMGADIVLSTYDTLRLSECKVRDNSNEENDYRHGLGNGWYEAPRLAPHSKRSVVTSKLHQLKWFRVILDESHLIANASCARARAAFTLSSRRRWCVTGTPIQNRTADLAALLQFVGLGSRAHALSERELSALVPRVVMRRLKSTLDARSRAPLLNLPKKIEETVELEFASDIERALYMLLHRTAKRQVLQYLQSKKAKQQDHVLRKAPSKDGGDTEHLFMHVFELILRLRQVCNACALVTADPLAEVHARAACAETLVENGKNEISLFSTKEVVLLERLRQQQPTLCAEVASNLLESTKLAALMQELKKVRARHERVLVISQWTSFLDLIEEHLEAYNSQCEISLASLETEYANDTILFAKLDGRMAANERDQVVRQFQQHEGNHEVGPNVGPSLDVLLLSLRTGGLGLNLTAAAHVFIMEPSWNPSLERQAIDRAHRFGQTREVRVVRFIIKGSIEERVVALQSKKRRLTSAFLGDADVLSSANKNSIWDTRLSAEDLRRLFLTQQEQEEEQHQHYQIDPYNKELVDDGSVPCIEISE